MIKKHYIIPDTEWLEAVNAGRFLEDSAGGSMDDLQDSGIDIQW